MSHVSVGYGDRLASGYRGAVGFPASSGVTFDEWEERIGHGRRKRIAKKIFGECRDCDFVAYSAEEFSQHAHTCKPVLTRRFKAKA